MAHLPDWAIERLRLRTQQPLPERTEPGLEMDMIDPVDLPAYYTHVRCPDPDCNAVVRVPAHEVEHGRYVLPGHPAGGPVRYGADPRCWLGGLDIRDVRSIVELREADGGRLKRAAHP